jgi:hypothetical protein
MFKVGDPVRVISDNGVRRLTRKGTVREILDAEKYAYPIVVEHHNFVNETEGKLVVQCFCNDGKKGASVWIEKLEYLYCHVWDDNSGMWQYKLSGLTSAYTARHGGYLRAVALPSGKPDMTTVEFSRTPFPGMR